MEQPSGDHQEESGVLSQSWSSASQGSGGYSVFKEDKQSGLGNFLLDSLLGLLVRRADVWLQEILNYKSLMWVRPGRFFSIHPSIHDIYMTFT